ncbi:MAG: hypothetical protein R2911_07075 [Caldilineaceae bacterium]
MKDNEFKKAESDELAAHYDFDYSKAKPNRFAARLAQEQATLSAVSTIAVMKQASLLARFTKCYPQK